MRVCEETQREPCINPSLANRKLSPLAVNRTVLCFRTVCVCNAYVWVSAAVQIRGLYTAVLSTTFNYGCEWIWEKVNCSVKLGNWLFDVWGLITWHFYYSTRSEGWREEEERRRRGQTGWRHTSHMEVILKVSMYMTGFQAAWWDES